MRVARAAVDLAPAGRTDAAAAANLERVLVESRQDHQEPDARRGGEVSVSEWSFVVVRSCASCRRLRNLAPAPVRGRLVIQLPATPVGYVGVELRGAQTG